MTLQLDLLKFAIRRTASWRHGLADRFPDDPRNPRAAEALERLVRTPESDIDQDLWSHVEPFLASPKSRGAISAACRTVEFSQHPRDLNEFLPILLDALWDASHADPPPLNGAALAGVLPTAAVQ